MVLMGDIMEKYSNTLTHTAWTHHYVLFPIQKADLEIMSGQDPLLGRKDEMVLLSWFLAPFEAFKRLPRLNSTKVGVMEAKAQKKCG